MTVEVEGRWRGGGGEEEELLYVEVVGSGRGRSSV
jgi:hypothetical protein